MIALLVAALVSATVAPEFVTGRTIPAIEVMDDAGRVRSSAEWQGMPVIVAPLYSRCPLACPMIVRGLKRGIAESSTPPADYRVVLLSFDPRDTPADLRRFRERNGVPLGWTTVVARGGGARRLLDTIGYRYAATNGLYMHPNTIFVLSRGLKTAKFLHGTNYPGNEIDAALTIASGRRDWIGTFGPYLLAFLLFVGLLSAISLISALQTHRGNRGRRMNGAPPLDDENAVAPRA